MSAMTVFYQECPVCGRNLRIAVKYFGRPMSCTHCEGEFIAGQDADRPPTSDKDPVIRSLNGLLAPAACGQPQFGEL
jgi:hypothetical protein